MHAPGPDPHVHLQAAASVLHCLVPHAPTIHPWCDLKSHAPGSSGTNCTQTHSKRGMQTHSTGACTHICIKTISVFSWRCTAAGICSASIANAPSENSTQLYDEPAAEQYHSSESKVRAVEVCTGAHVNTSTPNAIVQQISRGLCNTHRSCLSRHTFPLTLWAVALSVGAQATAALCLLQGPVSVVHPTCSWCGAATGVCVCQGGAV